MLNLPDLAFDKADREGEITIGPTAFTHTPGADPHCLCDMSLIIAPSYSS